MKASRFGINIGLIIGLIGLGLSVYFFITKPHSTYGLSMMISALLIFIKVLHQVVLRKRRLAVESLHKGL
jgi:hypothetical protein